MQDLDIRKALHRHLEKTNKKYKDTIIVDELDLCSGLSRIDVAVINGLIHGYEIKSEKDTLNRLPNQIRYYNKSLEKITLTINPSHLEKAINYIPEWWGIIIITEEEKNTPKEFRKAERNPFVDSQSLLQLLWKNELFSITEKYTIVSKRSATKKMLRETISQNLEVCEVSYEVREALKSRKNWRS